MKKQILVACLFLFSCFCSTVGYSQNVNFNEHLAPFFFKSCAPCHQGGDGLFGLTNYAEVSKNADEAVAEIEHKHMPPWPADPAFSHFRNERLVTPAELKMLKDWIAQGKPEGFFPARVFDPASLPVKPGPSQVFMPADSILIAAYSPQQFAFIPIDGSLTKDFFLSKIKLIPGSGVVKRMELLVNSNPNKPVVDGEVLFDSAYNSPKFDRKGYEIVATWMVGNKGNAFPLGTGMKLSKGSKLVLMIQYYGGKTAINDRSSIHFFELPAEPGRQVQKLLLGGFESADKGFVVAAGEKKKLEIVKTVEEDLAVFALFPQGRRIQSNVLVFGLTPVGDTIKMLRIPHWDPWEQVTYECKSLVKIPKGTVIHYVSEFDNTSENQINPNKPLVEIRQSLNVKSDLMELEIYCVPWKEGDEKIVW